MSKSADEVFDCEACGARLSSDAPATCPYHSGEEASITQSMHGSQELEVLQYSCCGVRVGVFGADPAQIQQQKNQSGCSRREHSLIASGEPLFNRFENSSAMEWNAWRLKHARVWLDFKGCRVDWTGRLLSNTRWRGSSLICEDMNDIDLSSADFSDATLYRCNLSHSKLSSAIFRRATVVLSYSDHEPRDGRTVGFEQSDLTGATFAAAQLKGISFAGAKLLDASFASAQMEEADLSGANLERANLFGAHLSEANLRASLEIRVGKLEPLT